MSLARYLSKLGAFLGSDGKVPAAALAAGAARANFGAGAVLQVLYSTPLSSEVVTSTTAELWNKTVTPVSSNSMFYVLSCWNTRNTCYINGYVNGSVVGNASGRGEEGSGVSQTYSEHNNQSFHWKYQNSSTSNIVFSEKVKRTSDSVAEIWSYGYMFSIIIEVAL